MKHKSIIFGLASIVLLALFLLVSIKQSDFLINIPGLIVVFCGTILLAMLSQSVDSILRLLPRIAIKLKNRSGVSQQEKTAILRLFEFYRLGSMRSAEKIQESLPQGLFKYGAQLVFDLTPREDIPHLLQWRKGALAEKNNEDIKTLRTMAAYAPAFGMLGTLFGLVQMLNGLGDSGLDHLGKTMGFAMMTTVYGLVAANLIFKPLAIQLERRAKHYQVWQNTQFELVLMLYRRTHPKLIEEYIRAATGEIGPEIPAPLDTGLVHA